MFCLKCGEAIPDGSRICPICNSEIIKDTEDTNIGVNAVNVMSVPIKKAYITWGVLALLSFICLGFKYMSVSIDLYFGGDSTTEYTGYYLTQCLGGTARLSGLMVIFRILVNIAAIVTSALGYVGNVIDKKVLKIATLLETILYLITSVIPLFHIITLLSEFSSPYATTSIGFGCYANIIISVISLIVYTKYFSKQ